VITKKVFDNLDVFKKLHPAYNVLTKENMLEGMSAPIHPGALKYYQETDLDKSSRRNNGAHPKMEKTLLKNKRRQYRSQPVG
jgi:hypothetical protein